MVAEKLRELRQAQPFQPFIIHLADGRRIRVGKAEWIGIAPTGQAANVSERNGHLHLLDLRLVTNVEVKPNAKRKKARAA
jgi:hypothetical protein